MKLRSKISTNLYISLLIRILLIYLLYSSTRVFFYIANSSHFGSIDISSLSYIFLGGLQFDTVAILYTNALFILMHILPIPGRTHPVYQKVAQYIYTFFNGIALLVNLGDVAYFPYTMKRTTSMVFDQFSNETNATGLLLQFSIDYWYILFIAIGFIYLLYKSYNLVTIRPSIIQSIWKRYAIHTGYLLVLGVLIWGGLRGGFRHSTRPISLSNAGKYVEKPIQMAIVQNTPFTLIRTINKNAIKEVDYFDRETQQKIFTAKRQYSQDSSFTNQNVVVILLESWSREFVGSLNRELNDSTFQGYTPFFDSLIGESLSFKYAFANGKKSIDALPSTLAGVPTMEVPYVLSHHSTNSLTSLATTLKPKGYHTSFFHGAPNGSMGFNSFTQIAGVEHYYGKSEYNNDEDFDGMWGIWDEEFLQYFANTMNSFPQPFFSSIFTVSSHHPFAIPERYEATFEKTENPLIRCLAYTDMALQRFFETAKTMPWYENTVFVITADHASFPMHKYFNNSIGAYSIPLVFYTPTGTLKGMNEEQIAQQIDILPTILDYLQYEEPFISFGKSLIDSTAQKYAVNYSNGYQLMTPQYLLQFDGKKSTGLYEFKTDRKLDVNLISENISSTDSIENFLKAFVQEYNYRIVNNKLTID